jgi:hypothetical protein
VGVVFVRDLQKRRIDDRAVLGDHAQGLLGLFPNTRHEFGDLIGAQIGDTGKVHSFRSFRLGRRGVIVGLCGEPRSGKDLAEGVRPKPRAVLIRQNDHHQSIPPGPVVTLPKTESRMSNRHFTSQIEP